MEQVEEICDHIILVNKGTKILDGSVTEVKNQFKENVFSIGVKTGVEHLMTYIFDVIKHEPDQLLIRLHEESTTNDVLKYFINQGLPISSFNEVLPSLNDIFIRLVEGTPETRQFQNLS
jgi:ABC-2 type transport system ATP-binding protein